MSEEKKTEKTPKILYKFLPQEFALKVLKEKRLKVSTTEGLNDVFDCNPDISDVPISGREKLERQNDLYGMLCFSKEEGVCNALLWGHYAENASGLALGFARADFQKYANSAAFDVVYSDSAARRKIDWDENLILSKDAGYILREILAKTYGYKARNWSYESEYRIIIELVKTVPDKNLYFMPFPHALLREVIVGVRSGYRSDSSYLVHYLQQEFPKQNIAIKFLKEHESEYRFEIDEKRTIQTFPELTAK